MHPGWYGRSIRAIDEASGAKCAFVTRYGDGLIVHPDTVLQENDILHVLVHTDASSTMERILTHAPQLEA